MEQELQDKFRKEIYEGYLKNAFECMANFGLVQKKHESLAAEKKNYDDNVKYLQEKIDLHSDSSKEGYNALKSLKDELKKNKDASNSVQTVLKKIYDEGASWQEKALTIMERADYVLNFTVNTPAQIAENKAKAEAAKVPVKTAEEIKIDYEKTQDGFEVKQ